MVFGSASRSNRRRTPATRCTSPSIDGQVRAQAQRLLARHVPHLDHAGRAVDVGDAPVHVRVEIDGLDARDRARREEREQRAPTRAAARYGHAELEPAVDHEPVGHAALGAQLGGRELEHLVHDPVHLPDAVEAGGGRDLRHRQVGVVEQAAGEVRAPRTGDLARRRADVLRRTGGAGDARSRRGASRDRLRSCRRARRRRCSAWRGTRARARRSSRPPGRDRDGTAGTAGTRRPPRRPRDRTGAGCGAAATPGSPPNGSRCPW